MTAISSAEPTRRDFLYIATATVGAVGAASALVPLIGQMNPDATTIAAGAPVDVDLAPIQPGQIIKVFWRSKPIFIFNRTPNDIKLAQDADWQSFRDPQPDSARVKAGHDQWLVVIGICTHLGCIPLPHQGNYDGWFCPATARNTIRRAASARDRRRSICRYRPINSFPPPRSGSAKARRAKHKVRL